MKRDIRALAGRGKVLPFAQSGDFFYKRGLEKLDKNNLPDAMAYYGRALKCDPQNREIRIAMAQVLTEMNRFEESNRILFTLTRGGAEPAEIVLSRELRRRRCGGGSGMLLRHGLQFRGPV